MCGISAYYHFDHSVSANGMGGFDALDMDSSLYQLHHRGPESRGKYTSPDGRCVLGHTRLSIIDLQNGQQPMTNETGEIYGVVNGELYDHERIINKLEQEGHTFNSRCDSEIAIHLYEDRDLSFLEEIRGEFAICIWDAPRKRFVAARDRYGIKPLYYTINSGTLLVASEIKAFLHLSWIPEWDVQSIQNGGQYRSDRTIFKNVHQLPPGHYLVAYPSGNYTVQKYWDSDYPNKNIKDTRDVQEMIQGVREKLVEAIRLRLRADVPVGVYLSGGIDSSAILGIATNILREKDPKARLHAFTISFAQNDNYDESPIAKRTAEFCDAIYHELPCSEDDLLAAFTETVWHCENIICNLNAVGKFLLSRFAHDKGFKVVLSGEGADEIFAGYPSLIPDYLLERDLSRGDEIISEQLRRNKYNELVKHGALMKQFKWSDQGEVPVDKRSEKITFFKLNHINLWVPATCIGQDVISKEAHERYGASGHNKGVFESIDALTQHKINTVWHPLHSSLYLQTKTILNNYILLSCGDRTDMAHSIESRTAFLDHHLSEYVNGLPPWVKVKVDKDTGAINEKWILKEAVKPFITDELYNRTKQSYVAPPADEKNSHATAIFDGILTQENVAQLGWLNWEEVVKKKQAFKKKTKPLAFCELLIVASYVVLQKQFSVKKWECHRVTATSQPQV